MSDLFEKNNRRRNQEGKFKKDLWWTPWNDAWSYKMSERPQRHVGKNCMDLH